MVRVFFSSFAGSGSSSSSPSSTITLSTCDVIESLSSETMGLRAGNEEEYIDSVGYVDLDHWGEDPLPAPMSMGQDDWKRIAFASR